MKVSVGCEIHCAENYAPVTDAKHATFALDAIGYFRTELYLRPVFAVIIDDVCAKLAALLNALLCLYMPKRIRMIRPVHSKFCGILLLPLIIHLRLDDMRRDSSKRSRDFFYY